MKERILMAIFAIIVSTMCVGTAQFEAGYISTHYGEINQGIDARIQTHPEYNANWIFGESNGRTQPVFWPGYISANGDKTKIDFPAGGKIYYLHQNDLLGEDAGVVVYSKENYAEIRVTYQKIDPAAKVAKELSRNGIHVDNSTIKLDKKSCATTAYGSGQASLNNIDIGVYQSGNLTITTTTYGPYGDNDIKSILKSIESPHCPISAP